MTYDQWKTQDPNDTGFELEEEDGPDELEEAYDRLKSSQFSLNSAMVRVIALESRIKTLEGLLDDCLRYLEKHYDVNDGDYGEPEPNEAMRLGNEIRWVTEGPG